MKDKYHPPPVKGYRGFKKIRKKKICGECGSKCHGQRSVYQDKKIIYTEVTLLKASISGLLTIGNREKLMVFKQKNK